MKKKLTFKEAKRLSILKWEWLSKYDVRNGGVFTDSDTRTNLRKALPELSNLEAECGFCE